MAKEKVRVSREAQEEEVELQLTPMIDVSFLILIFFMLMPFKTLEAKMVAFLPTDKGIQPIPQDPAEKFTIKVHIMPRDHKKRGWGPGGRTEVLMPTTVVYKVGDREAKDLAEVGRWILEQKNQAQAQGLTPDNIVGEIKAGHKIPHKFVVAILNKFNQARMEKVEFYGTKIPPQSVRASPYLPYPINNYVGEKAHR